MKFAFYLKPFGSSKALIPQSCLVVSPDERPRVYVVCYRAVETVNETSRGPESRPSRHYPLIRGSVSTFFVTKWNKTVRATEFGH